MRDVSHSTWIQIISAAVEEWRHREGWSRETVCAQFVEAFQRTERPNAWNVEFSNHHDIVQRQKNDADKIMRWLEDVKKDNNLLSANFARVIVATLPEDLRLKCAAHMLCDLGIGVRLLDDPTDEEHPDINDVLLAQIAHGKSLQATTIAIQNPTPENLEAAELQLAAEERFRVRLMKKVSAARTRVAGKVRDALSRAFHRKPVV